MSESETAKRKATKSTILTIGLFAAVFATESLASPAPVYLDLKSFFDADVVLEAGGAGLTPPPDATRNQQTSPLIPAAWERVRARLEAVSPHVDAILIYQSQGLMNRAGSPAFAGHPDSTRLYLDRFRWLKTSRVRRLCKSFR